MAWPLGKNQDLWEIMKKGRRNIKKRGKGIKCIFWVRNSKHSKLPSQKGFFSLSEMTYFPALILFLSYIVQLYKNDLLMD